MKILQVINNLDVGGAETLLKNYVLNNNEKGIDNHLCTLVSSRSFIVNELQKNNIRYYDLQLKNKYLITSAIKKLNEIIKQNQYDIVHMHLFPAQYYAYFLKKKNKHVKFIFTEHSEFNSRRNKKIFYPLEKKSYLTYDNILCISKTTKNALNNYIPILHNKTKVLYGGIISPKVKSQEKMYDLILVGSLRSEVKGVDIYLNAIKLLGNKVNKALVLGDGVLKEELINLRDKLGLKEKVQFLGNVKDVNKYLSKSKVFCLPSRWEGFGLAIIEAMSNGLPVVASKVGGIPEVITDGQDGVLVNVEDYKTFSKEISELLENEEKRINLGINAMKTAKDKFSINSYVNRLNNFYKSINNIK